LILILVIGVAVAALIVKQRSRVNEREHSSVAEKQDTPQPDAATVRVPAHYEQAPCLK